MPTKIRANQVKSLDRLDPAPDARNKTTAHTRERQTLMMQSCASVSDKWGDKLKGGNDFHEAKLIEGALSDPHDRVTVFLRQ